MPFNTLFDSVLFGIAYFAVLKLAFANEKERSQLKKELSLIEKRRSQLEKDLIEKRLSRLEEEIFTD